MSPFKNTLGVGMISRWNSLWNTQLTYDLLENSRHQIGSLIMLNLLWQHEPWKEMTSASMIVLAFIFLKGIASAKRRVVASITVNRNSLPGFQLSDQWSETWLWALLQHSLFFLLLPLFVLTFWGVGRYATSSSFKEELLRSRARWLLFSRLSFKQLWARIYLPSRWSFRQWSQSYL